MSKLDYPPYTMAIVIAADQIADEWRRDGDNEITELRRIARQVIAAFAASIQVLNKGDVNAQEKENGETRQVVTAAVDSDSRDSVQDELRGAPTVYPGDGRVLPGAMSAAASQRGSDSGHASSDLQHLPAGVTSKDTATELGELLDQAGVKLTFDRFRDSTKGCGPHCLAWERHNPDATWCQNHKAAMERGEYKPNPGSERTQTVTSPDRCATCGEYGKCSCPPKSLREVAQGLAEAYCAKFCYEEWQDHTERCQEAKRVLAAPAPADTVALSVYESAVRGRQDFRQALVEQRTLNDRLILVLRMIREGVADPKKFAEETLARVSRPDKQPTKEGKK